MKLSDLKNALKEVNQLTFVSPGGKLVPSHFHVTEIGNIQKHFIDCGGVIRKENTISFQLWVADDYDHRFAPEKLLRTIEMSEEKLNLKDAEIEVEYQTETVGKYGLLYEDGLFKLQALQTDCLAKDTCGVPDQKEKVALSELSSKECCTPASGCC